MIKAAHPGLFSLLLLTTALAFLASVLIGSSHVGWSELITALKGEADPTTRLILLEIRLPRAILGLMIGITLGLGGAVLQGFLRNPLAEPGLIGVSSAASLGAVATIYSGLSSLFALALPLGGITGALLAVLLIQLLAGKNSSTLRLILAGVAVTSFASALTSLALNLASNPFVALEIMFWLMGSLADRSFEHVWLSAPFMLLGWCLLFRQAKALDALTLGEEAAHSLGFNLDRIRTLIVIGIALSVGAATAVSGAIGFIGLVVPHLLRRWVAHKPSTLLLASGLGGACLTLLADIAVRVLSTGTELKLGVVTALIGAPFFLILIMKTQKDLP
ncbi:MAG: iron chelate uptake ABC transporter family permease subunit [Methyloprofundus sp.]|nr:iron chelate uptake ABC transporter family permease subunit [Methyloprofundus sp.]